MPIRIQFILGAALTSAGVIKVTLPTNLIIPTLHSDYWSIFFILLKYYY